MEKTLVTVKSANIKLGPGVVSTRRHVGPTCPPDCPLLPILNKRTNLPMPGKKGQCYATRGNMLMTLHHVGNVTDDAPLEKANGSPLIRHLTAGDWLKPTKDGKRVVDRDFCRSVFQWHERPSQRFTVGWGYTHAPDRLRAAGFGPEHQPSNLQIMASCHSVEDARRFQSDGWRTARVIATPADKAKGETLCPYDLAKYNGTKSPVTCSNCRLCMPGANKNIAFIKF